MNRANGFWLVRWVRGPYQGDWQVAEVGATLPGSPDCPVRTREGYTSFTHAWLEWGGFLGPVGHAVTRCVSCPFYQNEWSVCTKTPEDENQGAWPSHRKVPHPANMGPPPEWCPLRLGGIVVVLDPAILSPAKSPT